MLFTGILLTLLLFSSLNGQGTEIRFRHLTIEDGLSQSSANGIVQDNYGFIWIGTEWGLNRFDGYTVKTLTSEENNPNSISNNDIYTVYKDRSGILWVGTERGLNSFNPRDEIITRYLHDPDNPKSISNNIVMSICEDSSGFLWLGTECGLNKYDRKKNEFTCYQHYPDNPNSISHNIINHIYIDGSGTLWIGTHGGGLDKFDRKKERFIHYTHDSINVYSLSDNHVLCIYEDRSKELWIGTESGGLNQFDRKNELFLRYTHNSFDPNSIVSNHINVMHEDRTGTFWLGTNDHGLVIFYRGEERFVTIPMDDANPYGLSHNRIKSICEDSHGGLWFGTYAGGVNIYNRAAQKFMHYKHVPNNPRSLSHNGIRPIYEDRSGTIWIGTDGGGLNKFNRKNGVFSHFKHDPHYQYSLSDNRVFAVYEDNSGDFWVGTHGGGLNKFDRSSGRFFHFNHDPHNPNSLSNNSIRALCGDQSDILWIGTDGGGLNAYDKKRETFSRYMHDPHDSSSLSDNKIYCLLVDRTNTVWIGTFGGGLNRFNRKTQTFTRYRSAISDKTSISNDYILSIYEDRTGTLWIGTVYSGCNRFDRESETFTCYTMKDGLPDNLIYAILDDDRGNLWITTNKGLAKFNPQSFASIKYDMKDGLQSNEFNTGAGCKTRNGEMLFGGINGFNIFHPDSLKGNPFPPRIVITDFQLFNTSVPVGETPQGRMILKKCITETREIKLLHTDNVFAFEFSALDYVSPDKNQYAYMLEGIENEWNYTGSDRRYVTYAHLPPGEYLFKVQGSNNDGVWNGKGAALKIIIIPPFWNTRWFYVLCSIVIIFTAGLAYTYQIKRLKKQKEEEERYKVYSDISQVLERGKATMYRRNLDSDIYEYIGEGIKDITGYKPEEYSLSLFKEMVITSELIGAMSGKTIEEALTRLRQGEIDGFILDIQLKTRSGEIRWVRDMATGLQDELGMCFAICGIFIDITDRKLVEQKLAKTTEELNVKNKEMSTDLNMAREIQTAMLAKYNMQFPPHVPKKQQALSFSHLYRPASTLAGDFFDIFPVSDHEVGVLICDVMGHGARASLLTFFLRGLIEELMPVANDTVAFISKLNDGLHSILARFYTGLFSTVFYCVVDYRRGRLRFTNAGHPMPFLLQRSKRKAIMLQANNGGKAEPAIGIYENFKYTAYEYALSDDDIVFFYTDGIYEIPYGDGRIYGIRRLFEFVQNSISSPPKNLMRDVISEVQRNAQTEDFDDDVCLVTMHVKHAFFRKK